MPGGLELVERVKELFLELLLPLEELDVVDEQQIGAPVTGAERIQVAGECLHVVVAEALRRGVDDGDAALVCGVPNGIEQMRLTEARGAKDKQRVGNARLLHCAGGGIGGDTV